MSTLAAGRTNVRIELLQRSRLYRLSARQCRRSDTSKGLFPALYITHMDKKQMNGFTLYELLIAMVLIGIVLTIGIPNFSAYTQNNKLTSTANDLLNSFQLARSESARSKANITICSSANPLEPSAACGGNFNDGWIIFVDLNGDLIRSGDGENVLRASPAVAQGVTITTNGDSNYFSFAGTGLGRGDVGGNPALSSAMICDRRGFETAAGGRATARRLIATAFGRATVISDHGDIASAGGTCP